MSSSLFLSRESARTLQRTKAGAHRLGIRHCCSCMISDVVICKGTSVIGRFQDDDGRSPTATVFSCKPVRDDLRQAAEDRMDRLSQRPASLAVNDTHLEDSPFPALDKVAGQQIFHVAGMKGVEIEDPIDRKFYGSAILWLVILLHKIAISAQKAVGRSAADKAEADIGAHASHIPEMNHEHGKGFQIAGDLQPACIYWLKADIHDEF